jgi:hypothetical protein
MAEAGCRLPGGLAAGLPECPRKGHGGLDVNATCGRIRR